MTVLRFPWDDAPALCDPPLLLPDVPRAPKRRGRRPEPARQTAPTIEAAWRYHHLTITGPAKKIGAFAAVARGAGTIPWHYDTTAMEEDIFNLAASQPPHLRRLSIDGCRLLARQLRDRVEVQAAKALLLSETGKACPLDLHVLLPVPPAILQLGPSASESAGWLQKHWGTSGRLHQIAIRPEAKPSRRLRKNEVCLGFGFFAWAATPHAAIAQIAAIWPDLQFVMQALPVD